MALRLGALHDALVASGIDGDLAKKAAEEVANYEHRLAGIETKLAVLQWMVATTLAGVITLIWKAFS